MSSAAPAATESFRRNNFDLLRFVFASAVILNHSHWTLINSEVDEWLVELSNGQVSFGTVSVGAFFAISGYLITASWLRSRSLADYLKKRVARILPGFVGMTLFCLACAPLAGVRPAEMLSASHLIQTAASTLMLIQYKHPSAFEVNPIPGAFNFSAWTIRFEFGCYLLLSLLAAVGVLGRRGVLAGMAALVIAVYALLPVLHLPAPGGFVGRYLFGPDVWFRFAGCFLVGAAVYRWREKIRFAPWMALIALGIIVATFVLKAGAELAMMTAGSYLVFWLAFTPWLRAEGFGRYGDFSYGIYLYAFPIKQLLVYHFGSHLTPLTLFLAAWVLSVIAGAASWFLIERHFLKASHSRRPAITDPAPAVAAVLDR